MKTTITVFIIFLLNLYSFAQDRKISRLSVGESVPDINFGLILNSKVKTFKLSDFDGKIVILDYWSKWCTGCVAALPEIQLLQERYKQDIVILPVSFLHTENVVQQFIDQKAKAGKQLKLPFAVFENTNNDLFKMLPTLAYPHCIWIGKDRKVKKISTGFITDENVKKIIAGQTLDIPNQDLQMDFRPDKPLLTNNNGGPDAAFMYRSLITGYIDSIYGQIHHEFDEKKKRLYGFNMSPLELIKYSMNNATTLDTYNKQVIFEGVDPDKFIFTGSEQALYEWTRKQKICYDLIVPASFSREEALDAMHQDLDRFLQIRSLWAERPISCLALRKISGYSVAVSKADTHEVLLSETNDYVRVRKSDVSALINLLESENSPPIYDETGISHQIDFDLKLSEKFDLQFVNEQLLKLGLRLNQIIKSVPMIII